MLAIARTAIVASLVCVVPAFSQPAPDPHHPAPSVQQQTQPAAPPAGRPNPGTMGGYMMGGNMMGPGMMSQGLGDPRGRMPMMNMMSMMMGSQFAADHIEGRLAFIKAELKITDAQAAQWSAFADAVRGNINSMLEMRKSMMSGLGASSTLPERLALEDKLVTAHLAAVKRTEEAVAKLYGALTDDQKKIADTIVLGPMGMPMGMM